MTEAEDCIAAGKQQKNKTARYGRFLIFESLIKRCSLHGAYGIRTRDLHTASVARSQLRQCPIAIVSPMLVYYSTGIKKIKVLFFIF